MPAEKLEKFTMPVQGGMLEALGINLYANLGKCLVEFGANSYDSEASFIEITIPFDQIYNERKKIRGQVNEQKDDDSLDTYSLLDLSMDASIAVVIRDDGHGMTPKEVQKKFLPLNRNRRKSEGSDDTKNLLSENKIRYVMGRKGLGKLAGFGAAEKITIRTKREEVDFITKFTLDLDELRKVESLEEVVIDPEYENCDDKSHFTEITLTKLKYGAAHQRVTTIEKVIDQNFYGIEPSDFEIIINGAPITRATPTYEFKYPIEPLDTNLVQDEVILEDSNINLLYDYRVQFRERGDSLPASFRGARIYCNNRLAAGPTLLGLKTGMHNFYAVDYMEMIVKADDLDRHGIDLINTNRTELKTDNELVKKFYEQLQNHMEEAIKNHAKFRNDQAEELLKTDPDAKLIMDIVSRLPKKAQRSGKKIIQIVARDYGVGSDEFLELAPLIIDSMNAGEVLIKLIEAGTEADTVHEIADLLQDLTEIEHKDALKLFRARRSGINALARLINKGDELWKKSNSKMNCTIC